ncbi:hypothetical protein AQI88_17740 [Streptomyces cellostaticus]|uniref:Uncharacterized protein n=1 Tax=Streptomyces cellostaticus TaxID=67285 RepID=A0A101NKX7_9ACTN|nr:hypothetical protein AQI88_17740 [Streptomyces cellostaticus]
MSDSSLGPSVSLERFPGALQRSWRSHLSDAHLAADPDDPDLRWPRSADVLLLPRERYPEPDAVKWSHFTARFPGCGLIAVEEADQGCTVLFDDDTRLRARWVDRPAWASFALAASAIHAWARMCPVRDRPRDSIRITVRAGHRLAPALVEFVPVG